MTYIISGNRLADKIQQNLKLFIEKYKINACLDIFMVGKNFASQIYVENKVRLAQVLGIKVNIINFPSNIEPKLIKAALIYSNNNPNVHGIIIQLPLPSQLDFYDLISNIDPCKDVDGLHPANISALVLKQGYFFVPCTAYGSLILAKSFYKDYYNNSNLSGQNVLIINRSNLVGQPLAQLLLHENCTVTIAHSYTNNLCELVARSQLVFTAIGKSGIVSSDWFSKDTVVIDIGIHRNDKNQPIGDINHTFVSCLAITPVPGGVGPMTVSILMCNTIQAFLGPKFKFEIMNMLC